jgi:NADH-quinone oxidoreductase subunit J
MFLLFSTIAVFGALVLIFVSHPVQTILSLILVAVSVAGVCLMSGAEFLGFLFVVVYVGAIAVLFLFVVMMLSVSLIYDEQFKPVYDSFFILLLALFVQTVCFFKFGSSDYTSYLSWSSFYLNDSNLSIFNVALYQGFLSLAVISAGFLLFLSMVGSIFLTVQDYSTSKSQLIYNQIHRDNHVFLITNKNSK